jgi:hypothetical protein
MSYIFTTIAVGKKYFDSAINFINQLNKISKSQKFLIVTDQPFISVDNVTFVKFDENETKVILKYFNYNLKYIPIMECSKLDYKYVLFFDADWSIHNGYSEVKLLNFLDELENSNLDFIYERPHSIGDSKRDLNNCFWKHKIEPYGLMNTNFYDKGQVVNEQFMIFKNNDKLKIFVNKWKERNEFGVKNNIWAFAEGVEIGMSAIDAKMNMDWKKMFELKEFFSFVANTGVTHIRF